jgi:hypothetical protein
MTEETFGFSGYDAQKIYLDTIAKIKTISIHQILNSLKFHRNDLTVSLLCIAMWSFRYKYTYNFLSIVQGSVHKIQESFRKIHTPNYENVFFLKVENPIISDLYIQNLLFALKSYFKGFEISSSYMTGRTNFYIKMAEKKDETITYMSDTFDFDSTVVAKQFVNNTDIGIKNDEWMLDLLSIIKIIHNRKDEEEKSLICKTYTDDIIKYIKENSKLVEQRIRERSKQYQTDYTIVVIKDYSKVIEFYDGAFHIDNKSDKLNFDYLIDFAKNYFNGYKIKTINKECWSKYIILDWSGTEDKED